MKKWITQVSAVMLLWSATSLAAVTFDVYKTASKDVGRKLGTIAATNTPYGVLFQPDVKGLNPGLHGFHVHQKPQCGNDGKAAGGHFDPQNTGKHLGPYNPYGHLGDLPALYVNKRGIANHPVLAPRINLKDLKGHALIIHKYGDNYSDQPKPLGGGGPRVACALVAK